MNTFGIENPHEGSHVPGAACPACPEGYPKLHASGGPARVVVSGGKVSTAAPTAVGCGGYLHAQVTDGRMDQRCDQCGIPAVARESVVVTPADVVVTPPQDPQG